MTTSTRTYRQGPRALQAYVGWGYTSAQTWAAMQQRRADERTVSDRGRVRAVTPGRCWWGRGQRGR